MHPNHPLNSSARKIASDFAAKRMKMEATCEQYRLARMRFGEATLSGNADAIRNTHLACNEAFETAAKAVNRYLGA